MIEFLKEIAFWYANIFKTSEGRIGFLIVAIILTIWMTGLQMMIENKRAATRETKKKEELDKFN